MLVHNRVVNKKLVKPMSYKFDWSCRYITQAYTYTHAYYIRASTLAFGMENFFMIFRRLIIASNCQSLTQRSTSSCFCHKHHQQLQATSLKKKKNCRPLHPVHQYGICFLCKPFHTMLLLFQLFNEDRDKMRCDRPTSLITKFE